MSGSEERTADPESDPLDPPSHPDPAQDATELPAEDAPRAPAPPSRAAGVGFALALLALGLLMSVYRTDSLDLKVAEGGFGLQHYVAAKAHPENFARDWPNGVLDYDFTLVMRIQLFCVRTLGLTPDFVMYGTSVIHCLLYVFTLGLLALTLFEKRAVALLCVAVAVSSPLFGLNLSNFGLGLGTIIPHLYYGYANACLFLALWAYFRERWALAAVFLAGATLCHLVLGLIGALFIGSYLISRPALLRERRVLGPLLAMGVFFLTFGAWVTSTGNAGTGGIPQDEWIALSRIFNFHWHTITLGFLGSRAHLLLFPLLAAVAFFVLALEHPASPREADRKVIAGMIGCALAGAFGVIFSDVFPHPTVIKISPQRATMLISLFAVLYLVNHLYRVACDAPPALSLVCVWACLILVCSSRGLPLLPLTLLAAYTLWRGRCGPWRCEGPRARRIARAVGVALVSLCLLLLGLAFLEWKRGLLNRAIEEFVLSDALPRPIQHLTAYRDYDLFLKGGELKNGPGYLGLFLLTAAGGALLYLSGARRPAWAREPRAQLGITLAAGVLLVCVSVIPQHVAAARYRSKRGARAASFKQVQEWARANTAPTSLFIQDPGAPTGWRDYSERSSFGSLIDWAHQAVLYSPKLEVYQEGLRRVRLFGLDPQQLMKQTDDVPRARIRARKAVSATYNGLGRERLLALAEENQIAYAIFARQAQRNAEALHDLLVYENEGYRLYRLRE